MSPERQFPSLPFGEAIRHFRSERTARSMMFGACCRRQLPISGKQAGEADITTCSLQITFTKQRPVVMAEAFFAAGIQANNQEPTARSATSNYLAIRIVQHLSSSHAGFG
jgi:hypothetical protein